MKLGVFPLLMALPVILPAQALPFGSAKLRPGMPADSALEIAGKEFQLTKLPDMNVWIAQPMGQPEAPTYGSLEIANRRLLKVTREFSPEAGTAAGLTQALLDALRLLPSHNAGHGWVDTVPCSVARLETVEEGGKVVQMVTLTCGSFDTTLRAFDFQGRRQISVETSLRKTD